VNNQDLISTGVFAIVLSAILFVLYLVLPYERIRRLKIRLYRRNLAALDGIFEDAVQREIIENASDKVKERLRAVTPDALATEQRSFTVAWPATIFGLLGIALIVLGFAL
jgi:hypothetical protein